MIEVANKTRSRINTRLVKKVTKEFLKIYGQEKYDVSIAFVGDIVMQRLNQKYRDIPKPTDVLSFKGSEDLLGEVIIDYAQIKKQAKKFGHTNKQELIFILAHGLLHLLGYDDSTEKGAKEMRKLGEAFIRKLKVN